MVRRGGSRAGMGGGLFNVLFSLILSRFGLVGAAIAIGAFLLFGKYFQSGPSSSVAPSEQRSAEQAHDDPRVQFVSFVLDDVQKTWTDVFARDGGRYQRAKLVVFDGATQTGCGFGQSATGPFYCPRDGHVYLDLSFFRALDEKLGAPGDFAQAYVIAHEVGHHVQNLLGLTDRVHGARESERQGEGGLSVRLELQADCFAGVWAKASAQRDLLERGDLEEALGAAAAVGDDRVQRRSSGTVQPESWTHGSAAQRAEWFRRGYESGDPDGCDTFQRSS